MGAMTDLIHIPNSAQELLPGAALETDPSCNQLIRVTDGILYARREDDDVVVLPGDSIAVRAGEPRRLWNAGDETARVFVSYAETGCPQLAALPKAA